MRLTGKGLTIVDLAPWPTCGTINLMVTKPGIEPQRRLPFVGLILLLVATLLLPGKIWITLLIGFGGMIIVAYLWARQLAKGLSASRRLRFGWVSVGDRLGELFEIHNDSILPAMWVEVTDQSNVPGYRVSVVRSIGPKQGDRWRQSAVCRRRGLYRLGPWSLHSSDPFGIFKVTIPYAEADEIIIHPPVHTQIPVPLPAGQSDGRVQARQRSWQATINAGGVRDYRPRDPRQWIHWPTTARRDALFVRNFDLDAAGDIWLLLDLQASTQLGQGASGTEEHMVLLAAALSAQGLDQNRATGLATYGRLPQLIPPGRGKQQGWKILRALALLSADGQAGLATALQDLGQVAQKRSAAVIVTASGDVDWLPQLLQLAQRGISSQVVLLDRASFGDVSESKGGSLALRDALRGLGFNSFLIKQGELGQPAVAQERRGFWEFKVTPTGRVITTRSPLSETS